MALSKHTGLNQREKLLEIISMKKPSQLVFEKTGQIMGNSKDTQEKEATAAKLTGILETSKTEAEMLDRMDALL